MFYEIARGLVNFVFHIWFHITVVGKENIPKAKGGYIIASNHVSNNDPPMVGIVFKGKYTFMAKDELFHFNPIFTWLMKPEFQKTAKWTLFDLQDKLAQKGWMVPAYTLPANIQNVVVMRVLCKQGFSRDMADQLLNDIRFAITELNALEYPTTTRIAMEKNIPLVPKSFNHTGK